MLHLKKTVSFAIFSFFVALLSCKKEETKPLPTVSFTFSGSNTAAPATVIFINNSTNASSYLWDFGDSTASILPNPSHTYLKGGNYTVKLTATGTGGTNTQTQTITILNPTALKITV
jgi:PKD repeat protein